MEGTKVLQEDVFYGIGWSHQVDDTDVGGGWGQELRGGCFPLLQIQLGRGQGRQTGVVGMRPRDAPWGGSECQQRSRMDPVCLCSGLLRSSWPRALVYNLVCSSCWGPEGQGLCLIQL